MVGRAGAHGGIERLLVLDERQVERAHDDALVGDADAHAGAEVVVGEQGAQRLAERGGVDDLAVAQDAGTQMRDRALA